MAAKEIVKVFGVWSSHYAKRVEWALKLKGVEYEYKDEDLSNKSEELLQYNPVTKKIPVLVHNGKAVAESLVIVEYIDEAWNGGHPIMPNDPYERAQARFWAKFTDDKLLAGMMSVFKSPAGEELQKNVKEFQAHLKTIEEVLSGKTYFGGDSVGYLDIALGWLPVYLPIFEEIVDINVVNEENLPLLNAWTNRFLEVNIVKETLPPKDKLYALLKGRREKILSGETSYKG